LRSLKDFVRIEIINENKAKYFLDELAGEVDFHIEKIRDSVGFSELKIAEEPGFSADEEEMEKT